MCSTYVPRDRSAAHIFVLFKGQHWGSEPIFSIRRVRANFGMRVQVLALKIGGLRSNLDSFRAYFLK